MPAFGLILLFILPALLVLGFMVLDGFSLSGWEALFAHPQFPKALALSLFTGSVATLAALTASLLIAGALFQSGDLRRLAKPLGAMLALPHLAFAVGFSILIMPSGLIARVMATLFGWASPPAFSTVHDPLGLALIVALAAKETCFLLFVLAQAFSREDRRLNLLGQTSAAQAMGHSSLSITLRLLLPQIWRELRWPLVIVFVYAASVVDMAAVLGPNQPPTLAGLAWSDINSARVENNLRGGAAALMLALVLGMAAGLISTALQALTPAFKRYATHGPSHTNFPTWLALLKWRGIAGLFAASGLVLLIVSFAQLWTFPDIIPQVMNTTAWEQIGARPDALVTSLMLGLSCAAVGLVVLVAWLETVAAKYDQVVLVLSMAFLGLPALLTGLGEYRLLLQMGYVATWQGLFIAHLLPTVAYMFILLAGPYRSFDPRWRAASDGLMAGRATFLWKIKWPLLRAPLASAAAVGFAVAFAQYVPAQLVAAGRFDTLTIEAVTLSSGGNRPLLAAFAFLLMLPPLLAFWLAEKLGRQTWGAA